MKTNHWICTKFCAHRGLFNNVDVPENSLAAFEKAVQNNFSIEFDVQMTADGVLCVFHDDDLERMTGAKGDIRNVNWDEIKDLKLLNTQEKIPTLEEMLNLVNGRTQLIVEIKSHSNIGAAEQKIYDLLKNYRGEFVVESFNPFIVRWFKLHAPEIMRGQLSGIFREPTLSKLTKYLLTNLKFSKWNGSQFIAYNVEHLEEKKCVQRYRKRMPVIVYTVRSQEQYEKTKHLYDNMIFDSYTPVRSDLEQSK